MTYIHSRDNAFFKQLKRLVTSGRERKKSRTIVLDGLHLIEAYERCFGPVGQLVLGESLLATQDQPGRHAEICRYVGDRAHVLLSDALLRDLGLVDTPSGILALAEWPSGFSTVDEQKDVVLLDHVQDPGNVGTLLRTAAAAGCAQVLLSPGCAAVWSPKVLRAGQGAHFVLDIVEDVDLQAYVADTPATVVVTSLAESQSLFDVPLQSPLAWIFGAEGAGVSPELIAAADLRVRIPMPGAVESLNVGAAAAVCLFEAVRRRVSGG